MTVIIALSGKKRAGKNSVYFLLKLLLDEDDAGVVARVGFADALKEMACHKGWDGSKTGAGRKLLQDLGMSKRKEDLDFWVKKAMEAIDDMTEGDFPRVVVVTDTRFPNEVEALKKRGALLWRIRRPAKETSVRDLHPSETALDDYRDWDAILVANDLAELLEQVKVNLSRLGLYEGETSA